MINLLIGMAIGSAGAVLLVAEWFATRRSPAGIRLEAEDTGNEL